MWSIMGQDLVTLPIAVPLLLISLYSIIDDSLRHDLSGWEQYFILFIPYYSMSFLTSYNQLFLLYVAIFSISLYTFIGELISLNVNIIKDNFKP